jgi:hypothetical protein
MQGESLFFLLYFPALEKAPVGPGMQIEMMDLGRVGRIFHEIRKGGEIIAAICV